MRHGLGLILLLAGFRLEAQTWNDARTLALVDRAIERRQLAEADPSLVSYRATGRGVVTFLVEIGAPGAAPGRLVKGDELSVEVYWQRPDRSKQIIRAWRDSTFFPSDISYHRDHLGVVTDDFGPEIRIGGGDEVTGVVHPLGPGAPGRYDYAVRDTVTIRSPAGVLVLVAIDVRPRDPAQPAVIGSIYLDLDRAALVRSQFTFTRASYRDPDLEDIAVRLDRSLVDGRYWLPFHQEIELRRRLAAVDFPIRSVIRGRWEIGDYEINPDLSASAFDGPPIAGLLRPAGVGPWSEPLIRAVDSSLAPVDRRVLATLRQAALAFARASLLEGLPRTRFRLGRASELMRVNRVQGLALGLGVQSRQVPGVDQARFAIGVGTSDGRVTGGVELERRAGPIRLIAGASRRIADFSDWEVASGPVGSLAAQEGGRDYGDYVLVERLGGGIETNLGASGRIRVEAGREWAWSVATVAKPARGSFGPNPALGDGAYWIGNATATAAGQTASGTAWQGQAAVEAGSGRTAYGRALFMGDLTRRVPGGEVTVRGLLGLGSAGLPARRTFAIGGRATLPGEIFRLYGGRQAIWASADWLFKVPAPGLRLGWLGRTPKEVWVGPLIAAGWAGGPVDQVPWQPSGGVRPIVGLAAEILARTIRIEFGQALRGGRGPGLTIDITRQWWKLL